MPHCRYVCYASSGAPTALHRNRGILVTEWSTPVFLVVVHAFTCASAGVALRARHREQRRAEAQVRHAEHGAVRREVPGVARARAVTKVPVLALTMAPAAVVGGAGARTAAVGQAVVRVAHARGAARAPVQAPRGARRPEPALDARSAVGPRPEAALGLARALCGQQVASAVAGADGPIALRVEPGALDAAGQRRVPHVARARAVAAVPVLALPVPPAREAGGEGALRAAVPKAVRWVALAFGGALEAPAVPRARGRDAPGALGPAADARVPAHALAHAGAVHQRGAVAVAAAGAGPRALLQAPDAPPPGHAREVVAHGAAGRADGPARPAVAHAQAAVAPVAGARHAPGPSRARDVAVVPGPALEARAALRTGPVSGGVGAVACAPPRRAAAPAVPRARVEPPALALALACRAREPGHAVALRLLCCCCTQAVPVAGDAESGGAWTAQIAPGPHPSQRAPCARVALPAPARRREAVAHAGAQDPVVAYPDAIAHSAVGHGAGRGADGTGVGRGACAVPGPTQPVTAAPVPAADPVVAIHGARGAAVRSVMPREAVCAGGAAPKANAGGAGAEALARPGDAIDTDATSAADRELALWVEAIGIWCGHGVVSAQLISMKAKQRNNTTPKGENTPHQEGVRPQKEGVGGGAHEEGRRPVIVIVTVMIRARMMMMM